MPGNVNSSPDIDHVLTDAAKDFCHTTGLSDREQEILELAAQGLVDKEISARLGLAYTTVKSYWSRICFKIAVKNRQLAIGKLVVDLARRARAAASILPGSNPPDAALYASEDDGGGMS